MIHTIVIPPSKTKRYNTEPRKVTVFTSEGFEGFYSKSYWVPADQIEFQFELPDDMPYVYSEQPSLDYYFNVKVTYYNQTKTREETIEVVPS